MVEKLKLILTLRVHTGIGHLVLKSLQNMLQKISQNTVLKPNHWNILENKTRKKHVDNINSYDSIHSRFMKQNMQILKLIGGGGPGLVLQSLTCMKKRVVEHAKNNLRWAWILLFGAMTRQFKGRIRVDDFTLVTC